MVESKDEDVTYAVAIVPKIVTISMLLYPLLPVRFDITSQEIWIWCGVSINGSAQVITAAFKGGELSGELATVAKLSRVIFLVPIVLTLGFLSKNPTQSSQNPKLNK